MQTKTFDSIRAMLSFDNRAGSCWAATGDAKRRMADGAAMDKTIETLTNAMHPSERLQDLVRNALRLHVKTGVQTMNITYLKNHKVDVAAFPEIATEIIFTDQWEAIHELYSIDEILHLWRMEHKGAPLFAIIIG